MRRTPRHVDTVVEFFVYYNAEILFLYIEVEVGLREVELGIVCLIAFVSEFVKKKFFSSSQNYKSFQIFVRCPPGGTR